MERQVGQHTLKKSERLCSKRLTELLFSGGSRSLSAYPLRVVYRPMPEGEEKDCAVILVSVSKRHFKRAVLRNRVKRQIREAYRLNKDILAKHLVSEGEGTSRGMMLAFLWLSDSLYPTAQVQSKVKNLLHRVAESCDAVKGGVE